MGFHYKLCRHLRQLKYTVGIFCMDFSPQERRRGRMDLRSESSRAWSQLLSDISREREWKSWTDNETVCMEYDLYFAKKMGFLNKISVLCKVEDRVLAFLRLEQGCWSDTERRQADKSLLQLLRVVIEQGLAEQAYFVCVTLSCSFQLRPRVRTLAAGMWFPLWALQAHLFGLQTVETPHQLSSPSSALPIFLSPQDALWFGRIASAFYVFIAGGTRKLLLGYSYALGQQLYFALILSQGCERAYWSVENKYQLHKSILDSVHSSWPNNMIALDTGA